MSDGRLKGIDRLRYIGYCISQMPPKNVSTNLGDFVEYAKFHLSQEKHVLLKDQIWDRYSDEDVLVEYFASVFSKNENARKEFELLINAGDFSMESFADWADSEIVKNEKEMLSKTKKLEEKISFSPETLGN